MNYNNHPKMKHIMLVLTAINKHTQRRLLTVLNETLDTITFTNDINDFEKLIELVKNMKQMD